MQDGHEEQLFCILNNFQIPLFQTQQSWIWPKSAKVALKAWN